jgi:hypothetical protein
VTFFGLSFDVWLHRIDIHWGVGDRAQCRGCGLVEKKVMEWSLGAKWVSSCTPHPENHKQLPAGSSGECGQQQTSTAGLQFVRDLGMIHIGTVIERWDNPWGCSEHRKD